ncbi:MAG: nitroreductase family protein [Pontiellaceae bacterium]|jgi:nitroreductase|nr:nitroreductase family protein [Pontiellaceae bacterium]
MKFIELAKKRSSIRSYTPEPVSETELHTVLEAGRLAPTACNLQPFQFVVVREKENLTALATAYPRDWFKEAPVVIVICTDRSKAWKRADREGRCLIDVDGAIAADHMTLAAADIGLGTCWIGAFNPEIVRNVLGVPETIEPLVLLTLGHPNETGRPKTRLPIENLIRYEKWK